MLCYRTLALALSLLLASLPAVRADGEPARPARPRLGERLAARRNALLPPGAGEALKLTPAQREQVARLQKEFADKCQEARRGMRKQLPKAVEAVQKAREDGNLQPLLPVGMELFQQVQLIRGLREEHLDKVRDLLTDEQKKTFDDLRKEMDRRRPHLDLQKLAPGASPKEDRPAPEVPPPPRPVEKGK